MKGLNMNVLLQKTIKNFKKSGARSVNYSLSSWGFVVIVGLFMVFSAGTTASGQESTSVSANCPSVLVNNTTTCTVTVSNTSTDQTNGTPEGSVTVLLATGPGNISNDTCDALDSSGQCTYDYTPSGYGTGTHQFNLEYNSSDTTSTGWTDSTGSATVAVNRRDSSTEINCEPTSVEVDETLSCTVTVTDNSTGNQTPPEGEITVSETAGSGDSTPCILSTSSSGSSSCTFEYTPTSVDNRQIIATFPQSDVHNSSTGTSTTIEVTKRQSKTVLECSETPLVVNSPTQCTVTVTDASYNEPPVPTGEVLFGHSGDGSFSPVSSCTLDSTGQCSVTYTPTNASTNPQAIQAEYGGDATFQGSVDEFSQEIQLRSADVQLSCQPSNVFIDQQIPCMVTVTDDSTDGTPVIPEGNVSFADGVNAGTFSLTSCTLDSSGSCSVNYTPGAGDAGTTDITAAYDGSSFSVHSPGSTYQQLNVELRTTKTSIECGSTILVDETTSCTVTVEDVTGVGTASSFSGDISYTKSLSPTNEGNISVTSNLSGSTSELTESFNYWRTRLDNDGDMDTIGAEYVPNDNIHDGSVGGFAQGIQRRPTETTIDSCDMSADTCNFTVTDQGDAGTSSTPGGYIVDPADNNNTLCTLSGGSCTATGMGISGELKASVTVQYDPNDRIHLKSSASDTFPEGENTVNEGALDTSGPGGATNVDEAIFGFNSGCLAANSTILALEATELILDPTPDPIVGFGIGAITGTTIPTSDIAATVIGAAQLGLEAYIAATCTDLDGDGLYDIIEHTITNTDHDNPNTDGDAMGDNEEISYAGGYYGGTACTNPNIADSDSDSILDGYELSPHQTEPCNSDTDGDSLNDGEERATSISQTSGNGFSLSSSFSGPFADVRDHADPLLQDTDGDGLRDDIEIGPGKVAVSTSDSYSPYINEDDSDGDGLLDGNESSNGNATWDYTKLGGTGTTGEGETHLCMFDTDGDGLSDGAEVNMFGSGLITVHSSLGTETTAALDSDMDDDYLSDSEEVNRYNTDPEDYDTDDDGLWDSIEVATTDNTIFTRLQNAGISLPYGSSVTSSSSDARDQANPRMIDTDGDGINDDLEIAFGCNCADGGGYVNDGDSDDDGLQDGPDKVLYGSGSDVSVANGNEGELNDDLVCSVCDPDSDGDGLSDGEEVNTGTNPLDWDSDDDGLSDREELQVYFTDPNVPDTDSDNATGILNSRPSGITLDGYSGVYANISLESDGEEALSRTGISPFTALGDQSDPLSKDTDGDGLQDDVEFAPGCNCGTGTDGYVNDDDSDDDGLQDGREYELFGAGEDISAASGNDGELNDDSPCCICDPDSDGDGLSDGEEIHTGMDSQNALDWDSDDDGLSDKEELQIYNTDPNNPDTDGDGADGNIEARDPTISPTLSGHTGAGTIDALSDCEEAFSGTSYPPFGNPFDETDPLQVDTDGDGLDDATEFRVGCSCENTPGSTCPTTSYAGTYDPLTDGYANSFDSDDDGLRDNNDIHADLTGASIDSPGMVYTYIGEGGTGDLEEQNDDTTHSICDPDSDGDGLLDGEEKAMELSTDWLDWDTDDDGRNDWHEHTGGGPIPTDPNDPDTDDDGLLDSAEVFGSNTTNPLNADTDGDGLCDGGGPGFTPAGTGTNPLCTRGTGGGSVGGIGDHTNPGGLGEDENGNGSFDSGETDPNQHDTDGDGEGDGIEKLGFSTSRQGMIPSTDLLGRPINVTYPATGCLDPLNSDTDGDGLRDGYEDRNHDGNFDFNRSDFDNYDTLPGPPIPDPSETNPCDHDTDNDGLTDDVERNQPNPSAINPFNPTNPLDHDTDNDRLFDGEEVAYVCTEVSFENLDNDEDGYVDEDPVNGIDDDLDGYVDEDGPDFWIRFVEVLDPTNRDSDSDGFIDGRDPNPCNSPLIPILENYEGIPADDDEDGFSNESEILYGTDPDDDTSYPDAFTADLDGDEKEDDLIWLLGMDYDCEAKKVIIDIDSNVLIDASIKIVSPRDVEKGDFDGDEKEDDYLYSIEYAFSNQRILQPRFSLEIYDLNGDHVIDRLEIS